VVFTFITLVMDGSVMAQGTGSKGLGFTVRPICEMINLLSGTDRYK
jgi:hypothetical protein